jgi:S-layer homology domain/Trypsin
MTRQLFLILVALPVIICMSCGAETVADSEGTAVVSADILNGTASNDTRVVGIQKTYVNLTTGQAIASTCSGTPIVCTANKTVILTAAHCLNALKRDAAGLEYQLSKIEVTADSTLATGLLTVTVFEQHPAFQNGNFQDIHDIAALIVPSKMNVTCVDFNREILRSERLKNPLIAGYGANQDVAAPAVPGGEATRRVAPASFRNAFSFHFQAATGNTGSNSRRQCVGDSGGPTFATLGGSTKVLGVSSFARNSSGTQTSCGDDLNGTFNVRADMNVDFLDSFLERQGLVSSAVFSDVASHPARDEIVWMNRAGNISGFPNGTFKPDEPVTRGQFAAILAQTFLRDAPLADALPRDVPANYFAAPFIRRVLKAGFMRGLPDGTFAPESPIIRQDVLVALVNGLAIPTRNASSAALDNAFTDTKDISSYAKSAAINAFGWQLLRNQVLLRRRSPAGNLLRPLATATRAEVASFVWWARMGAQTTLNADFDADGVPDKDDFCEFTFGSPNNNGC